MKVRDLPISSPERTISSLTLIRRPLPTRTALVDSGDDRPAGANLLPPLPPNFTVAVFAVVTVVDAVVFVVVIFGEGGAPLEMIEVLHHLVLIPIDP